MNSPADLTTIIYPVGIGSRAIRPSIAPNRRRRISGAKAKRPALDQMLAAAHRREFDVVLVWASDRLARSVRHFLEVLDTLNHLGIEFVSFRENLDTG